MSDGNMDKFLDSYDKVESAPKCLKVQHTWEPNQVMSPRAARAFWLEQEVVTLRGSLAKLADGNTLKSSEYWSEGFHHQLVHLLPRCLLEPLRVRINVFKIGLAGLAVLLRYANGTCLVDVEKLIFKIGLAL